MTTDHTELRAAERLAKLCNDLPLSAGWVTVPVIDLLELLHALEQRAALAEPKGKYSAEFEEAWSEYPTRPGNSKAAAWKAWQARLKAKVSPEALVEGVRKYAAYCKAKGTEAEFVKMASTFFGPAEHYAADWALPRTGEPRRVVPDRRTAPAESPEQAAARQQRWGLTPSAVGDGDAPY